ncbi:MAG: hypothetical protein ACM3PT_09340 [Deltaproteobacteria bacterium]
MDQKQKILLSELFNRKLIRLNHNLLSFNGKLPGIIETVKDSEFKLKVSDKERTEREIKLILTEISVLEKAKIKLLTNSYGICSECMGNIPFQKILLDPLAEFCNLCQD